MARLGKRRCYGCIQARSSLAARFLILKAGQELRQELDLSYCTDMCTCTWLLVTMSY